MGQPAEPRGEGKNSGAEKRKVEGDDTKKSADAPHVPNPGSTPDGGEVAAHDDGGGTTGIVFHQSGDYKFGAVYWRYGFSLPENGRMKIRGGTLSFKGILGTRFTFDLEDVEVEKTSRLGGLAHDAFIVNSKKGETSADASTEEEGKFLFSVVMKDRKKVLDRIQSAMANKQLHKEREDNDANHEKKKKFRMPPDATLQKMKIIGAKKLKGVSLQDYYEVAWSEGHDCDKGPIYAPFLQRQGKNNVSVSPWETGNFEGDWCGETYTEERIVTFQFMKQTIGQTLVEVKHTQRCRRMGNDQCIVQIQMKMSGFPYADCFVVEVRHVASRVGNDLSIQIGMFVKFLKSCMFENKIRTNTGAETTKAQLMLLKMTSESCVPYAKDLEVSADESEDEAGGLDVFPAGVSETVSRSPIRLPDSLFKVLHLVMMAFVTIFRTYVRPYMQPELFDFPPSTVEEALESARARMKKLEKISLKSVSEKQRSEVSREIALIDNSINTIEKMAKNET